MLLALFKRYRGRSFCLHDSKGIKKTYESGVEVEEKEWKSDLGYQKLELKLAETF